MNSADCPPVGTASPGRAPHEPPQESLAPARGLSFSELARSFVVVSIIAASLFWTFTSADIVSVPELRHYSRILRSFRQVDAQTAADVLSISFELHKNYDTISQDVNHINTLFRQLRSPPGFLSESDTGQILYHVDKLGRLLQAKHDHIGTFVRESAVLRNSVRYFPTAIKNLADSSCPPRLCSDLTVLSNNVMTFLVTDNEELLPVISGHIKSIRRENANLPPHFVQGLNNVLDHIDIVIKTKQIVDSKLHEIAQVPTDAEAEKVIHAYSIGHENAVNRARFYRTLLFASALLLTLYLALLFTRLSRTTQALRKSNHDLKQHIYELHNTQSNLKLYATLFNSAAEGMVITDANTRILLANPAFTTITGYDVEEIRTCSPSLLSSGRQSRSFYQNMWKIIGKRGKWQGEIWNRRKNGEMYPEWLSITAVFNSTGDVTHYIGVFSDITERKKNEAHIRHLSLHDPLTNLPNRLLMQERLNEALVQSQRINSHTAVLFVNLDRFRNINDTLGNELGDALLQQVAHRSQSLLRDTDTVSRLGSDEFVFILPDVDRPQNVASIARKLLISVNRPYLLGGHDITITASIGIALSDADGKTAAELLRNADAAMSRAKEDGRNNFRFYSTDMNIASLGDLLLENQLRNAIKYNELEIFYQPKIDSRTGIMQSAEALLRWQHPKQGLIQPSRFIRLAEESGLIISIGTWVLRTVCRQIHVWREAGLPVVPIAVNLSAQQFLQSDLSTLVSDSLKADDIDPGLLELELTESVLIRNVERTIDILSNLRQMGISLSIDDFGTGYSSLSYLKQFKVNLLKIDKSFIADIQDTNTGGTIAIAIIGLAHALGIKVIAEGVETEEQRRFLLDHGCDLFQGYLFSHPVPAVDFAQKLAGLKNTPEG
ncbi:MAG: EAL domain-containing protein [Azoarcus sp.]|jgi:diguanylate cyclase (GGDEF)-like protein/PAS domain S-box-containing protein|nr:EAL domain-containing protein [Azoarcus sp.]